MSWPSRSWLCHGRVADGELVLNLTARGEGTLDGVAVNEPHRVDYLLEEVHDGDSLVRIPVQRDARGISESVDQHQVNMKKGAYA